jgi:hypothetical protein
MRLRYAGQCRACGIRLPAGATAVYDRGARTVTCVVCPDKKTDVSETFTGSAGASAQREYERRRDAREERIRDAHPHLGGLILALSDDPQSTRAWATGARGEERLGRQLDGLVGRGIHVLHDRRIPGTSANIDHIAISSAGVFVIDAKKYNGQPSLRVEGGIIRPRTEKLMIGSRDSTGLVAGVHRQVNRVRSVLDSAGFERVSATGMLCFVEAEWPLFGGDFTIDNVRVAWPRKTASFLVQPGDLGAEVTQRLHRILASSFPPA